MTPRFADNLNAQAWLWKDHTAHGEAGEITALARQIRPHYLGKCGGAYSSEWFWSKLLHCANHDPEVFAAAQTWVEQSDYIPAMLTGRGVNDIRRNICAAGHKAMAHASWNGYPDEEFLAQLHPKLAQFRRTLPNTFRTIADPAGTLASQWAQKLGLSETTTVAVGAIDAHMGAIGAGITPNTLVKIIGTSSCDLMTAPLSQNLADIPGLCGIVPGSILPDAYGLEAGQSAVGDIFNWFTQTLAPKGHSHESLSEQATKLKPGESGLLALDWHNGNRTVLIDQRLTGVILGLTLHSTPAEIYRALIEATAFGARIIMERFEEYGIPIHRVINAGGIAAKNPLAMQLYADIMNRPLEIASSNHTCALGAAIAGAVAANKLNPAHGHKDFETAIRHMTAPPMKTFTPVPVAAKTYESLYRLYTQLHDAFGLPGHTQPLAHVMKHLLAIRDKAHTGNK